jgi:two-component system KDP operon response regulator KdpE
VRSGLAAQGFVVVTAMNGDDALRVATTSVPDLVVVDLMLPGGMNGLEVCRRIREWANMPILVLSAIGQESQKVAALNIGADDYLTKPFGMDELTARVRAALRRYQGNKPEVEVPTFTAGSLTVDYGRRMVLVEEVEVKLTPLEYDILKYLTQNADRVITHRQLLSNVWGAEYSEDTQLLRVHIGHLRQKIGDQSAHERRIINEPGVGYRFRT